MFHHLFLRRTFNLVNLVGLGRFRRLSFPTHLSQTIGQTRQAFYLLLGFILILCSLNIKAQENSPIYKDFESWNKISARKKLGNGFSVKLNQSLRLRDNAGTLKQVFTEAALNYKINKRLTIGTGYRIIVPNKDDIRHRIHFLGTYKISPKRWDIGYRLKLDNNTEEFENFDHNLRNRLTVGYNIRKWKFDPEIAVEIFYNYRNNYQGFNKIRCTIGTEYKINKRLDLGISTSFQRTFAVSNPRQLGILSLSLNYGFKK